MAKFESFSRFLQRISLLEQQQPHQTDSPQAFGESRLDLERHAFCHHSEWPSPFSSHKVLYVVIACLGTFGPLAAIGFQRRGETGAASPPLQTLQPASSGQVEKRADATQKPTSPHLLLLSGVPLLRQTRSRPEQRTGAGVGNDVAASAETESPRPRGNAGRRPRPAQMTVNKS